jgi:hypothetical protein
MYLETNETRFRVELVKSLDSDSFAVQDTVTELEVAEDGDYAFNGAQVVHVVL